MEAAFLADVELAGAMRVGEAEVDEVDGALLDETGWSGAGDMASMTGRGFGVWVAIIGMKCTSNESELYIINDPKECNLDMCFGSNNHSVVRNAAYSRKVPGSNHLSFPLHSSTLLQLPTPRLCNWNKVNEGRQCLLILHNLLRGFPEGRKGERTMVRLKFKLQLTGDECNHFKYPDSDSVK